MTRGPGWRFSLGAALAVTLGLSGCGSGEAATDSPFDAVYDIGGRIVTPPDVGLQGATVILKGSFLNGGGMMPIPLVTDAAGRFRYVGAPVGIYTAEVDTSMPGYRFVVGGWSFSVKDKDVVLPDIAVFPIQ